MRDSLIAILLLSICVPLLPFVHLYVWLRYGQK